jgi:murein DD-endopeptidase MepM/ murein hydrolase activator NlpD
MLFTIKRPRSERFFQLSFNGFRPNGRNRIEQVLNVWFEFAKAVYLYLLTRSKAAVRFVGRFILFLGAATRNLKSLVVRKLIWSRGRLGRPMATGIVMSAAFLVFMLGEVFNSSKYVVSLEISPDYLANVSDIIPQRNVAMTTIPEDRRSEPYTYYVQDGDTLYAIGERFKISTDAIKYVNGLTDFSVLKPGQEIVIPPLAGLIHEVESGDSLQSIARKYDVPAQAIADFNYILDTGQLAVGTELVIPGGKVPQPVAPPTPTFPVRIAAPPSADTTASRGWCMWPTTARLISQYFSWYHNGLDIATPWGGGMPPIYACSGGTVTRAGWDPFGLGLHVRVNHGNGYETVYGHMSTVYVSYGQAVGKGQTIGLMGNTGRSTGPHVHFTVLYNGIPQNPLNYIN